MAGRLVRALPGAAFVVTLLSGCEEAHEPPPPVRPVLASAVKPQTVQVFGPFAGSVEARYTTNQGFRTSGRMIVRDVSVGSTVRKGQRLALLDETLLAFAFTQAKANVSNAEAQLDNAEAAAERKRILARTQAVPQSEVDSSTADEKTAAAQLEQAKAAQQKAQDNLRYAGLYSEYDGVVIAWNAEVGQDIAEGAGVVTLARPDILEAVVDIPDDLIGKVREKDSFDVVLQASGRVSAKGIVREIAPSSDKATRTRRVRFALDNPPFAFRIGSTVTVSITTPISPRTEIPEAALFEQDGGAAVWVVAPGAEVVSLRRVQVVARERGRAQVTGLGEGDQVVRAGIRSLEEGQVAKVIASFSYP